MGAGTGQSVPLSVVGIPLLGLVSGVPSPSRSIPGTPRSPEPWATPAMERISWSGVFVNVDVEAFKTPLKALLMPARYAYWAAMPPRPTTLLTANAEEYVPSALLMTMREKEPKPSGSPTMRTEKPKLARKQADGAFTMRACTARMSCAVAAPSTTERLERSTTRSSTD